ncbi:MAG: hypothetical protein WDW38_004777 [Sanguina aurantia]
MPASASAAPGVDTTGLMLYDNSARNTADVRILTDPSTRKVMYNLPYEDLHAPILGPAHPYQKDGLAAGMKNHRSGHVEDAHMNQYHFDEQYNTFHSFGYAQAPSGEGLVGDMTGHKEHGGDNVFSAPKRQKTTAEKKAEALRKLERLTELEAQQPDQPYSLQVKQPWANKETAVAELTSEQKDYIAKLDAEKVEGASGSVETKGPTSFFHGKEKADYQGRSWMSAPKDRRKESDYTYLPKRWIHTWSGHTKGVNAIRFFPDTGHLLLSAGLDGKVKVWDVHNSQKCMRTYLGHSKGVRDVKFNHDGTRFLSTGYDKNVRLWDTETGQVLRTFNTGKMFYTVEFHPDLGKQNTIMGGCHDKKIYQWDTDTGDMVQEYNYHLGAVNTITFIDEGRRFVSTSDDKTIRVWEFGIPVQIKYIADPSMHSVPAVVLHPSKNFFLGQSMDNQIVTYACKDNKFKPQKNKTFKGHNTAGTACQIGFSPDAKYVMSGDTTGKAFFWEWAHPGRIVRTIQAHEANQPCIGVAWHPLESSKVATCGWDGCIKYWD